MKIILFIYLITCGFLFNCNKKEGEPISFKTTVEYPSKRLKKITLSYSKHDTTRYTDKINELWVKDSIDTIASGTFDIKGYKCSGKFLIVEEFPADTTFHFEIYHGGELLKTEIPEWEYPKLGSFEIVPFTFKMLRHYACSYDDTIYVGEVNRNDFYLQKSNLPTFLELSCSKQFRKAYRFYYLPTWEKPLIFDICLSSDSSKPFLAVKRINGSGGYRQTITGIDFDTIVFLNPEQTKELDSLFENSTIWTANLEYQFSCGDGKTYKIEGLKKGIYGYRSYCCVFPKSINDIFRKIKKEIGIEEEKSAREEIK